MKHTRLGNTGINVSCLCFGTLTMGPLQQNLPLTIGAGLLELAFSLGVNFIDTAELYGTYPYIKHALKSKPDAVICTKCYAYDEKTAEQSYRLATEGIGREYIDIFLLHEQESEHTIRGHYKAIEYFLKKQREGQIGAVGLSTHFIAGIRGANKYNELSVVFPLINLTGIGIADGGAEEMLAVIQDAHNMGKGVFAMKPFGGGHLLHKRKEALRFLMEQDSIDAIAVGMQTEEEVRYNCAIFSDEQPNPAWEEKISAQPRRLLIHDWCEGCGACTKKCGNHALTIIDEKACVDSSRCVLCGYCAASCPQFCIKVV